ncbi:MAG TPA: formimidoylglutamate deiminase [Thermoanaerobaculia bacterium]|jgi:formimidoylglutamate deiminase|nr:formimidoylglutamate deiminase [Thermoanaerobaculia bacterium]
MTHYLEADLTWTGERFEPGVRIGIDPDGRIASVGTEALPPDASVERLTGRALLPGFVNVHSHAFQRGLRGRGETFPAGAAGSFWTWREAMYGLVEKMTEDRILELSFQAFREMRAAGITCVGEFHYLHHSAGANFAFDDAILAAAEKAGIRLVLLETYYRTGGIGQPLSPAQKRFDGVSPGEYWFQMNVLGGRLGRDQTLGAVVHSVRAASLDELGEIYKEARRRGLVFHIHIEEQQKEIEDCLTAYGKRPMAALLDACGSAEGITAVHCTHTSPDDLARFLDSGGTACICPTTEGNLGDGLPDLARFVAERGESAARLALGTDSNARISFLEEMRWLEYGQRLRTETRGALRDANGSVAPVLLRAATLGGSRSLGIEAGAIRPGAWADLVGIDLSCPELDGWEPETLLESLIFGAGNSAIAETWVGGRT